MLAYKNTKIKVIFLSIPVNKSSKTHIDSGGAGEGYRLKLNLIIQAANRSEKMM